MLVVVKNVCCVRNVEGTFQCLTICFSHHCLQTCVEVTSFAMIFWNFGEEGKIGLVNQQIINPQPSLSFGMKTHYKNINHFGTLIHLKKSQRNVATKDVALDLEQFHIHAQSYFKCGAQCPSYIDLRTPHVLF